jgi:methyl-accepting chemotaxis protein
MNTILRKSAAFKLNAIVFGLVCFLLLGFGVGNYYRTKLEREASLNAEVTSALDRLFATLPLALWNMDKNVAEQQLRAEMGSVYLHSLVVTSRGEVLLAVERGANGAVTLVTKPAASDMQQHRELSYLDGSTKQDVGIVTAHVSYVPIQEKLNQDLIWTLLQIVSMCAILLGVFATSLNKIVFQPLHRVRLALAEIANGEADLTKRLPSADSIEFAGIAEGFNQFAERMEIVVSGVRRDADLVARGVSQIMQGSQDLAQRTESQAMSMQTMTDTMDSLSNSVQTNTENAQQADSLAFKACEAANQGGSMMQRAVRSMEGISEGSLKIADITNVIDGIAFQTNILALNAAVEAARAGDQGRGFAVVASEVRSLAKRSADAAKEIKLLISGSVDQIRRGNEEVNAAGSAMGEIERSIQQVQVLAQEMNQLTQSQRESIALTVHSVSDIDRSTQQNAALVEETAAASESLNDSAQSLVHMMSAFHTR